jgi:transcriptional regulator with XRE-family HTH domain
MAPEWLRQHENGGPIMSLRERVHELRKEHGWSQADLATRISADAGQISRYEHGRITPSADVIIRLAETFDVSTDYLLLDNAPRRPHHTPDEALGTRLATIAELNPDDLTLVTSFIDALVTKTRLKALAGGAR